MLIYLRMVGIGRMIRILGRSCQVDGIDVVGALGVAGVDVWAWCAAWLLCV